MATLRKITETDLANKGVMPLADVPGLSAEDMKAKFEEIVRSVVIPIFNQNMQDIENAIYGGLTPGSEYLVTGDEITTYAGIKAATEARKIASAVAVKEMNTALEEWIDGLDTTIFIMQESIGNRVFVKFYPNGGTGTTKQQITSYNGTDHIFTLRSTVDFTKAGHTFAGWALSESGAAVFQPGDKITVDVDGNGNFDDRFEGNVLKLYATWQENTP